MNDLIIYISRKIGASEGGEFLFYFPSLYCEKCPCAKDLTPISPLPQPHSCLDADLNFNSGTAT